MLKGKFKGIKAGYVVFACVIALCFFMASSFMVSFPNNYVKSYMARVDAAGSNLKTVDEWTFPEWMTIEEIQAEMASM